MFCKGTKKDNNFTTLTQKIDTYIKKGENGESY